MGTGGVTAITFDLKLIQISWELMRGNRPGRDPESPSSHEEATEMSRSQPTSNPRGLHHRVVAPSVEPQDSLSQTHDAQQITREQYRVESTLVTSWKNGAIVMAGFFASFIVIMGCRGAFSGANRGFDLFANFYLAGTIIFGGGPVVIPLLREYIVAPGWVSPRDFLLGLAITQAFPGPNFNFAVYLGALAVQRTP